MSGQPEITFVPEIRIPKPLVKQAAEAFVVNLVNISLPIIQILACKKPQASTSEGAGATPETVKEQKFKNKLMRKNLQQLKSWYWKDLAELCGECDSKIRCIINTALMEVIHMNETIRASYPLHKLALQLIFGCEAGDIGGRDLYAIEPQVARQFSEFVMSMSPFFIHGLRDNCFRFDKSNTYSFILSNSGDLRRIQLYWNISSKSLNRLRIKCIKAETITLDFVNELKTTKLVMGNNLYKTFFSDLERNEVYQLVNDESEIPKSFLNLREIRIRCDHIIRGLTPFIQCLHCAYSQVKLTLSCLVSQPFDYKGLRYPFVCPSFRVFDDVDGCKVVYSYFYNEDLKIDETTEPSLCEVVCTEMFLKYCTGFCSETYYMEDMLSMMQLCKLRYIFNEDMIMEASPRIAYNPDQLRILYIFGPIPDEAADEDLVYNLNLCTDLKVLGVTIKPMAKPILEGLNPLTELKILSIYFTALIPCSESVSYRVPNLLRGPIYLEVAEKFLERMILAAPNLEVLEAPCVNALVMLVNSGCLNKIHTLSVTYGLLENIMECVMKLPNLKVLLLEKFLDPNIFHKLKSCFRYTRLQISYKAGRLVLPYEF